MAGNARRRKVSYHPNMPRKRPTSNSLGPDWYLPQWMATLDVTQADLVRDTGWSPSTVNDIFHGRTEYYRAILNEVANVLHVQPYELLMHPEEAMAIRRMRQDAVRIAAEDRVRFVPEPAERLRG